MISSRASACSIWYMTAMQAVHRSLSAVLLDVPPTEAAGARVATARLRAHELPGGGTEDALLLVLPRYGHECAGLVFLPAIRHAPLGETCLRSRFRTIQPRSKRDDRHKRHGGSDDGSVAKFVIPNFGPPQAIEFIGFGCCILRQRSNLATEPEAICSHCVLPPIRKPVSSMCLTGAAATRSRNSSAKPWKRAAQS